MTVDNNILYRQSKNNYGEMIRQIVMPNSSFETGTFCANCRACGCTSYISKMSRVFILVRYEKEC